MRSIAPIEFTMRFVQFIDCYSGTILHSDKRLLYAAASSGLSFTACRKQSSPSEFPQAHQRHTQIQSRPRIIRDGELHGPLQIVASRSADVQ